MPYIKKFKEEKGLPNDQEKAQSTANVSDIWCSIKATNWICYRTKEHDTYVATNGSNFKRKYKENRENNFW